MKKKKGSLLNYFSILNYLKGELIKNEKFNLAYQVFHLALEGRVVSILDKITCQILR